MPILAIKDNPPVRYPNVPIEESDLTWFIARVKPRQEKALAFDLMEMEVGYYMPLFNKTIRRPDNGKKRTSILPLFPSYVPFECRDVPEWLLHSDRVASILEIKAQERFKQQLGIIYKAREGRMALAPVNQIEYVAGRPARILSGPCAGLVGMMVKKLNDSVLALQIEGIGIAGIHVNVNNLAIIG